jgi:ketosteroid isomerase-like protein
MAHPTPPRAVFERLLQGISNGAWSELADLYAEDAVVELPFAPAERPASKGARPSGPTSPPRPAGR